MSRLQLYYVNSLLRHRNLHTYPAVPAYHMGMLSSCPAVPRAKRSHANLYMLFTACYLMLKHWFWSTNTCTL